MSQAPPPQTLHVVFSPSAAPELRKALKLAGRTDAVAACIESFSWGPIDPGDPPQRARWMDEVLETTPWDLEATDRDFWRDALDSRHRLVAWTSTRVALERAGFLNWLWRLGDAPCEVIDLSKARVRDYPAILGLLYAEDFLSLGLLDAAAPLSPADRARHHETWQRLRAENAPLRIIQDGELASAPLDVFDSKLLSHASSDWTPAARLVGEVLAEVFDDYLFQVGDIVLASRLWALVEAGQLEEREMANPKHQSPLHLNEVRLPGAAGRR